VEQKFKISFDFKKYWSAFIFWLKAHVRVVSIVSASLVFLILVELVFGFGMPAAALPWSVYTAIRAEDSAAPASVVGIVEPYANGTVYAKSSGVVASVFKQTGDMAYMGDLLFTISNPAAVSALASLTESLNQARDALRSSLVGAAPAIITAPANGRLVLLNAEKGASMDGGAVALIAIDGLYTIDFAVPDSQYAAGDTVKLRGGKTGIDETDGTVTEVTSEHITVSTNCGEYMPGETARLIGDNGNVLADGIIKVAKPALVFGVSGVIAEVSVNLGTTVKAGDQLFKLEGPLVLPGHESEFDAIEKQVQALAEAQETVDALSVYAPADGVISSVNVQVGGSVSSGQLALTLTNPDLRKVTLTLSSAELAPSVGDTITLTGFEGNVFDALVESVENTADAINVNCSIRYSEELQAGDELTYALPLTADETGAAKEVCVVNGDALIHADGNTYVLREPFALPVSLKLRGAIGRLFHPSMESLLAYAYEECLTPVEVVPAADGSYIVLDGLSAGDSYIVPEGR
jgi:multidrug resistance efflux pump